MDKEYNFEEWLLPLYEAMKNGDTIKKVTCMAGTINREDREKDFTMEDFKMTEFTPGMQSRGDRNVEYFDYVETDKVRVNQKGDETNGFYMTWVIEFEL